MTVLIGRQRVGNSVHREEVLGDLEDKIKSRCSKWKSIENKERGNTGLRNFKNENEVREFPSGRLIIPTKEMFQEEG